MGKKKNNDNKQQPQTEKPQEEEQQTEGKFLLGKPKFKKLENGRYKCVQTGHELPADARESYAQTKHCRLGLIDSALARNKPPLNMFNQDPLCRSKLICKLTGHTVNKTEEHIWKHINGKRFLNMLEKEEAEAGKESSNGLVEEGVEQKSEKAEKSKEEGSKKKKKNKKKKEKEIDVSKVISEVRNPEEHDSDAEEEEFWMPPVGDRWDFDDGKDRWGSDLESDVDAEDDDAEDGDADETDAVGDGEEESNETQELSKRTKRMSIEIEPSDLASKKKKKTQST
ncbi:putative surfeit locus protein [Helianthus annuus]|nr:putative surfeit locus protein [Helianthus annuus]